MFYAQIFFKGLKENNDYLCHFIILDHLRGHTWCVGSLYTPAILEQENQNSEKLLGWWMALPPSTFPVASAGMSHSPRLILTSKHLERHLGSCRHSRLCCPRRKHRPGGRRSLPQDPTPQFQMEKSNYPQVVATKPRGTLRRRDRIPTSPDVCLPWKVLMWSSASGV